jgi:phosphopantetheinyl transferase (holo-ACP synthase)
MGKPNLAFHNAALERLLAITPANHTAHLHLALSDEGELAWAVAVIEAIAV